MDVAGINSRSREIISIGNGSCVNDELNIAPNHMYYGLKKYGLLTTAASSLKKKKKFEMEVSSILTDQSRGR